ncbi:LOW QUALITY PROTEIN: zinc finger protein 277 [Dermatophagoides pteronyssinus]|uniref:LOW QUALITY PROTEIN: zinc finger protein 277 n=1 Tax=Dermatophagoides pteronyssinus TaxID=6956 RepID=UPI003F6683BE
MDHENFIENINCFVCKKQLKEQSDELFEDFFRSYEQHLLNNHQIIIPKFQSVDEFIDFLQQCISLDQLQSENRCQQFTFKKFDKIFNYFLIDKQQMSEIVIKKIVEKHFLEKILNESQKQRSDPNFSRMCLFCRKIFSENRSQLFDHLYNDHNFFIGHPDNIIDANEFLDILEEKLKKLLCLYCEREFKNWNVLKEHMRKKGHKTLNHNNREYDRFYLINYLCNDKHWKQIKKENDFYIDNTNDDWDDWIVDDDNDNQLDCLCFFCPFKQKFDNIRQHLRMEHDFDFDKILAIDDFYDRIMIINFIRKNILTNQCYICQDTFENRDNLFEHLQNTRHMTRLPSKNVYHSPEYYFPALDDDCFLMFLDDCND